MEASLALFPKGSRPAQPVASGGEPALRIVVYGEAAPAGSKKTVPVRRKDGSTFYQPIDANPKAGKWKNLVAQEAGRAMEGRPLFRGALEVTFTFYRRRPQGHYGKKGLKPSAPAFPLPRPDVSKTIRGVEDALTGVVWSDDAIICAQHGYKWFGEPERVEIEIRELEG